MTIKHLFYLIVLIACLAFTAIIYLFLRQPKIAYVRNIELVYGYNAMKEAHAEFKAQTDEWQANIDTLRIRYQTSVAYYQQNFKAFNAKEKEEQVALLKQMETDLKNYTAAVQQEAKDREAKLTQGVLSQVNSFIANYAKRKGYDIILGSEGKGSILYGVPKYDITNELIEALNKEYKLLPADTTTKLKGQ